MGEIKRVAVYLGATTPKDPAYVKAVVDLGHYLARHKLTLVYGGSNEGTMKTLADAVTEEGGQLVGVFTANLPLEHLRQGLTETFVAPDLATRKKMMLERADAVIAMPGSYGTWDELFDALALAKLDAYHGRPVKPMGVLNVDGYFDDLIRFIDHSCQTGFTAEPYARLLKSGKTVEELFRALKED